MSKSNILSLVYSSVLMSLVMLMISCKRDDEREQRIPDCQSSLVFKIGDLDITEIEDGGEIHFKNKSDEDSLQLILAKGDLNKAIANGKKMPRFYFDFGDGTADSSNESLEVRHVYKVKEGEDVSTYHARLIFFDLPSCEAKPIEIKVTKKPDIPPVVNAKIKVNKNRIYEGQTVVLEEYGTGTFAWEWYEGTTMIGRGKKITYTPNTKGVKNISCKVNHAEGNQISVSPQNIQITVIRRSPPPCKSCPRPEPPCKDCPPPPPPLSKFEKIILPELANEIENKLKLNLEKRAKFTVEVDIVLKALRAKYPDYEDNLSSSKILIDDKVTDPSKPLITTLSGLRNDVSSGEDVARSFKGAKVISEGGKLKILK